ncbi:hypothetical protein O9K51_10709 [Purpureocillium lavendulum]|uniref:DDE Tnp4 domain-containing protein n=1 Tax=Purpureocillium lavendulum TaxID=1247861 RepID=A0AB34FCY6_9HYPO|nr:hypothetical protein O9K51_10709 [Purpureocillium lavendulum]
MPMSGGYMQCRHAKRVAIVDASPFSQEKFHGVKVPFTRGLYEWRSSSMYGLAIDVYAGFHKGVDSSSLVLINCMFEQ